MAKTFVLKDKYNKGFLDTSNWRYLFEMVPSFYLQGGPTRSGSVLTGLIPPRQKIQVFPKVGKSQGQGH